MPIVSSLGLNPYTGNFTERELKHLLRRVKFGTSRSDLSTYSGQSLTQVLNSVLIHTAEPSPPLNYYQSIKADTDVALGQTWINAPSNPDFNFLRVNSFKCWLSMNYYRDNSITEKMALFLHSFIPISQDVGDPRHLYNNYKMLRANCLGNFKTIIKNTLLDSGMLKYLNGDVNQKKSPDENLARELQELFTLGKGFSPIYSEADVKEAARVLTGYQIDNTTATYTFNPSRHDSDNKTFSSYYNNITIQGKTGAAGQAELDELVDMIFLRNDVALHFCKKLYGFFIYYDIDATVESNFIQPLADIFRSSNYEILPVIQKFFASEHFFDSETFGSHIKSPLDYIFGQFKEMNIPMPDNTDILAQYEVYGELISFAALLRQNPYDPPNVSGWEAYYQKPLLHENWITTDTIANRNKISTYLIYGYKKRGFQIQANLIEFSKGFSNPSNPNLLISDALNYLHTIPANSELKAYLKTILLYGQSQDYYWTNAWNDYIANPNDAAKKKIVSDLLFLFYKYILELAEYQLM